MLLHFWNFHDILNILKKKVIVITNVFPKLKTVKYFVRSLSEKERFGPSIDNQHVKRSRTLLASATPRETDLENVCLSDM